MVECAYEECDIEFEPKNGRKFCSPEHAIKHNNKKAFERYKERKARMSGKHRVCKSIGCGTLLRKTNNNSYCDACERQEKSTKEKEMRQKTLGILYFEETEE